MLSFVSGTVYTHYSKSFCKYVVRPVVVLHSGLREAETIFRRELTGLLRATNDQAFQRFALRGMPPVFLSKNWTDNWKFQVRDRHLHFLRGEISHCNTMSG